MDSEFIHVEEHLRVGVRSLTLGQVIPYDGASCHEVFHP